MRTFSPQQLAVFGAATAVLLILLHLLGVLALISGWFLSATYRVAAPLHRIGAGFMANQSPEDCADIANELEQLTIDNANLRTLAAENAALKTALEFKESEAGEVVLARVVAESSDITKRGLVIDRGLKDGLKPGQPVVVDNGLIIGKIHSVNHNSATVLLLIDSMSRLAVSVQGGSGTAGLLEGSRGLSMSISLIPQNEIVNIGDVVVTSGLESGIRRGLIVGVIEKVHKDSQEPFQTATVEPLSRSENPVFVQVLTDNPISDEE
ncbi:MAG: rod shape-determining protein MreC [Patescibacteria group bacterium]